MYGVKYYIHVFCSLHTDGQKIAKKLCKGVSRESSKAKQVLEEYNAVSSQIESSFQSLSLEDVLSPTCSIWQNLSYDNSSQIPFSIKQDIIEAYLLNKRSDEELLLLRTEMCNVIEFWQQREECIKNLLLQFSESASTQFNRGCVCLLKRLQWETELYHSQATTHFSSVSENCTVECYEAASDSSEYESDSFNEDSDSDIST